MYYKEYFAHGVSQSWLVLGAGSSLI